MKIYLGTAEKKLLSNQLYQLAINAAQGGDKKLHKALISLASGFQENATVAHIRRYEAEFLLDTTKQTVASLTTEILPKILSSNKTDKEKEESTTTINALVAASNSIISSMQAKLDEV